MDIWSWVAARHKELTADGQGRLAALLYDLPSHVVNLRHSQVDALVPEAVALSRARKDPWLELFFRHWELQSRVLTRMHGEGAISLAVDLVDFSHRPETEGCPQSVCTIQDLAACYGIIDGPGWAPERIEVTAETLQRIDPSWGCFDCISGEHADAVRDDGRAEHALAFIDRQIAAKLARASDRRVDRFCGLTRVSLLSDLGRHDEALALVDQQLQGREDSLNRTLLRKAHRARVLARLGRFEDARACLPEWSEFTNAVDGYEVWSECAMLLVRAGALAADGALGQAFGVMVSRLDKNGAVRSTLHVAERHVELSLRRGALWSARRALATMERCVPRLRKELGALDLVARARESIRQFAGDLQVELPESADVLLDQFSDGTRKRDAESAMPLLEAARERWPAHLGLLHSHASALHAIGAREDAIELLSTRLDQDDEPIESIVNALGNLLIDEDRARFDAFAARVREKSTRESIRVLPGFLLGVKDLEDGQWSGAIKHLRPVVEARPDGSNARRLLARALLRSGVEGAREALSLLAEVEAGGAFVSSDHWDRMSAATVVGEWEIVRASAAALQLALSDESGPVRERWELCLITVDPQIEQETSDLDDDEGPREFIAVRTGPVTAEILHVAGAGEQQRFRDQWVFDARPQNKGPAKDADEATRRRHRWEYAGVHRLRKSGYRTVEIDGAVPTDEQYDAFALVLEAEGIELRRSDVYKLTDPRDPTQKIDAVYVRLAVPPEVSNRALHALLERGCEGLALPFAWPALADEIGDEAIVLAQRARGRAYGVID